MKHRVSVLTDEIQYKSGVLYARYANNGWRRVQIDVNSVTSF